MRQNTSISTFNITPRLLLLLLTPAKRLLLLELVAFASGATYRICRVLRCGIRVRLVRRLERRIHTGLEAQIREVSAPSPGEDREEREHDGSLHVVHSFAVGRVVGLTPRVGQIAESNEVQECPQSCNTKIKSFSKGQRSNIKLTGESQIAEHVVFPGFNRGHLLE